MLVIMRFLPNIPTPLVKFGTALKSSITNVIMVIVILHMQIMCIYLFLKLTVEISHRVCSCLFHFLYYLHSNRIKMTLIYWVNTETPTFPEITTTILLVMIFIFELVYS
jgi:hypothetical protein